jgi:chromate transport protein ChrA
MYSKSISDVLMWMLFFCPPMLVAFLITEWLKRAFHLHQAVEIVLLIPLAIVCIFLWTALRMTLAQKKERQ